MWGHPVYAQFLPEIDPFHNPDLFRPLAQAYNGINTFWSIPSPEPDLPDWFWAQLAEQLVNDPLRAAATALAAQIAAWEPNFERLMMVSILRAGVPIADWLTQLLPGSQTVSMSLFVGLGIDSVALSTLQQAYPEHRLLFVDGWTGRGGVARELAKLNIAPLATLLDPWGWADFSGTQTDLFCPTACFTGPTTLGFSRTFFTEPIRMFSAYLFPESYTRLDLVRQWQRGCKPVPVAVSHTRKRFFQETTLRVHSNEVCRALINGNPGTIYFAESHSQVETDYALLLALAELRHISVMFEVTWLRDYQTKVACLPHGSKT
jgi:hypothetical protein